MRQRFHCSCGLILPQASGIKRQNSAKIGLDHLIYFWALQIVLNFVILVFPYFVIVTTYHIMFLSPEPDAVALKRISAAMITELQQTLREGNMTRRVSPGGVLAFI